MQVTLSVFLLCSCWDIVGLEKYNFRLGVGVGGDCSKMREGQVYESREVEELCGEGQGWGHLRVSKKKLFLIGLFG